MVESQYHEMIDGREMEGLCRDNIVKQLFYIGGAAAEKALPPTIGSFVVIISG